MTGWLTADMIFDGRDLRTGAAIRLDGRRVAEVAALSDLPPGVRARHAGHVLTPGFVDLQVNGGGGVLFNATPTPEGARAIAAAHRALGTTRLLPTVITDRPEVMAEATRAIETVAGGDGILGLHIEGPHIAPARRGTHDARHIRPLDAATFAVVRRLRARDIPVLLTLAPEAVAPGEVADLVSLGATVAIGHSDATLAEVRALEAEGATLFTHLYNAMSQMTGRAPGVVGAAITSDKWCSVILDGHHVSDEMLTIACAARPRPDRMLMVSDAMPTVNGPDRFRLYGREIRVVEGRLVNDEGALAGAHVSLAQSIGHAVHRLGLPLRTALRMAITHPAEALGRPDLARLTGLARADLAVLDATLAAARPLDPD